MPSDSLRLHTLTSYSVTSTQKKERDSFPYTEVVANVSTDQFRFKNVEKDGYKISQKEVIQQVTLEIWKSDDFFQEAMKVNARLNDMAKTTSVLVGKQMPSTPTPERTQINKESLCVFLPFEQFESDQQE